MGESMSLCVGSIYSTVPGFEDCQQEKASALDIARLSFGELTRPFPCLFVP